MKFIGNDNVPLLAGKICFKTVMFDLRVDKFKEFLRLNIWLQLKMLELDHQL